MVQLKDDEHVQEFCGNSGVFMMCVTCTQHFGYANAFEKHRIECGPTSSVTYWKINKNDLDWDVVYTTVNDFIICKCGAIIGKLLQRNELLFFK